MVILRGWLEKGLWAFAVMAGILRESGQEWWQWCGRRRWESVGGGEVGEAEEIGRGEKEKKGKAEW